MSRRQPVDRGVNGHGRLMLVAATLVVVVVVVVVVAAVLTVRAGSDDATGTGASSRSQRGDAESRSPATPPQGGVRLPAPAGRTDEMPVRFPHTDLGATATAVAVARLQLGFDYDQAAGVADHFATAQDRAALVARSRSAVTVRRHEAGLPAGTSSTPAPAAYSVTPLAYVVKKLADDHYAVSLLSYVTLTTASGTSANSYYSGTSLLRWTDGDWKVTAGSDADRAALAEAGTPATSTPGSKEYRAAGWMAIAQGDQ